MRSAPSTTDCAVVTHFGERGLCIKISRRKIFNQNGDQDVKMSTLVRARGSPVTGLTCAEGVEAPSCAEGKQFIQLSSQFESISSKGNVHIGSGQNERKGQSRNRGRQFAGESRGWAQLHC